MARPAREREWVRIRFCAHQLRRRADLGPPEFRTAVASWLDTVADVTERIDGGSRGADPTLPCVTAILDVIETRPGRGSSC